MSLGKKIGFGISLTLLVATIALAGRIMEWNGRLWEDTGGCQLAHPSLCVSGHWTDIGPASSGVSTISNNNVSNSIIKSNVFQMAAPKATKAKGSSPKLAGADAFVNMWDAGGYEGKTYGINPTYSMGDKNAFTITIPLHMTDPDSGDGYKTVGIDGLFKSSITDSFSIGGHANYLKVFGDGSNPDTGSFAAGPFASYLFKFTDSIGLSLGVLVDYFSMEDGDDTFQLIPGANLGFSLSTNWALNGYAIAYKDLDAPDGAEDFYNDLGAEVSFSNGPWSMRMGAKTTLSHDYYDAVEVYLGSEWRF